MRPGYLEDKVLHEFLPNITMKFKSRKMKRTGHVERMRQMRSVQRILAVKPKDHLTSRHMWTDNIKIDHKGTGNEM
jgi:uncharacterized protein YegJ (DUF2314 family)